MAGNFFALDFVLWHSVVVVVVVAAQNMTAPRSSGRPSALDWRHVVFYLGPYKCISVAAVRCWCARNRL